MASIVQKLLKKSYPIKAITSLTNQTQSLDHRLSLFAHESQFLNKTNPKTENSSITESSRIFPTFPFGSSLNPISTNGFVESEVDNVASVDCWRKIGKVKKEVDCYQRLLINPRIPFGYGQNSILISGLVENVESDPYDDSKTIWADSVKKKRKRKMNKHKLKKLKKSLRRKT